MNACDQNLPRTHWQHVAQANGIQRQTFDTRLARGWTPQDAATRPVDKRKGWKGRVDSEAAACRQWGLHTHAIHRYRVYHEDYETDADTIAAHIARQHERGSVASLARDAGLNPNTVRDRIRRGWTLERALSGAPMRMNQKKSRGVNCERKPNTMETRLLGRG